MIPSMTTLTLAQQGSANPLDAFTLKVQRLDILNHPDVLLQSLVSLHVVWAAVFLVVGLLCVIYGYKWHKWVVVVCAFLAGLGLGQLLSAQMGGSRVAVAAVGLLCAVVATPLLRVTVAVFGGMTGAFIGANVWTALNGAPENYIAGAGMGFIGLALASFILFRPVVVAFTSIGGAALAVIGGITLLLHVPGWEQAVITSLSTNHLITLLVGVAAATGMVFQHAHAGSAGGSAGGAGKGKAAHA